VPYESWDLAGRQVCSQEDRDGHKHCGGQTDPREGAGAECPVFLGFGAGIQRACA
jgi:hypothetical protein